MTTPADQIERLMAAAGKILSYEWREDTALTDPVVLKDGARSLVLRCRLAPPQAGRSSVLLKQVRDDACGFSDWVSAAFLTEIPETHGLAPRFLGGDLERRFFLLEDLGGARSLQDVLTEGTPEEARSALRALAVQMARLHGATFGKDERFAALRAALPGAADLGRRREAERWLESRPRMAAWWQATGTALPPGFDDALRGIAAVYAEPGPFLAFTHGDPAPSNNHIADDGTVRLLDFEYGAFRHALYDITAWNVLCPLPQACVQEMRRCFRNELAKTCPAAAARDAPEFARAWAHLCAFRALAVLSWIPPDALREDRPWVGDWRQSDAVFAAIARTAQATADIAQLAPVQDAARALLAALRTHSPTFAARDDHATRWPALEEG